MNGMTFQLSQRSVIWRFLVQNISIKYYCSLDLILFRKFIGLIDSGIRKLNVPKVELNES